MFHIFDPVLDFSSGNGQIRERFQITTRHALIFIDRKMHLSYFELAFIRGVALNMLRCFAFLQDVCGVDSTGFKFHEKYGENSSIFHRLFLLILFILILHNALLAESRSTPA